VELLERAGELAELEAIVASGRGRLVLIAGEAGIGKTSLVRALRERLDATFFIGACEPLSVPVPLAPLRELAAGLEGADALALTRSLLAVLRPPAVAVLEDAHWADPATLDVLRLLARRVEDAGVVVLVTYRDDELAAHPALAMLVGDLATSPAATRMALAPLSPAAVRELAGPAGVDPAELTRLTGGNPFLVAEALAARDGLPPSLRDATMARVARLGPDARGVVDAAAVIGQRVPPDLLAAVVSGASDAVEEALALGVLTDDGATLGFRHELTRQAIESAISAPRRAELHARVYAALAERAPEHARLAHHAELAGLTSEAGEHAALAAAEAERVGALREAALQLERALRFGGERFELLLRFSRAANFSGRMEAALDAGEEAVALAGDARERGRALNLLAAALWSLDRVEEARDAALEAIAALEPTEDLAELARAHAAYVRMEAVAFDPATAIAAASRALELAARAGAEEARVDAAISLAVAHGYRGEPGGLTAARAEAAAAGLHIQVVRSYVNELAGAADARDHATVDALAPEAIASFEERGLATPAEYISVLQARSLFDRGRWDEALERAEASRRRWHGGVSLAHMVEGLVAARRGEGGDGRLAEALDGLAGVPEGARHGLLRAALAEAAWLRGDRVAQREHALAGLRAANANQFARSAGDLALWAARSGESVAPSPLLPAPARLELTGDWRGAIAAWRDLDAPYEAALAALPGDDRSAREAVAALHRLGATAAARAFARDRAEQGAAALRGPRRSTLTNPAGLTRREQEVLGHVAAGDTNAAIARALHLSERTVEHHVSSILGKLGVPTRTAAVRAARNMGAAGAQDG
jgi:DNA-binding CsgD family transcriptional regulator/tetratricopeptide (TPR) repeat protein